jgi:hypothetical protein
VALPATTPPISDVVALSCPSSGDGCMGIGNLQEHFSPPSRRSKRPPRPQSSPLVISNLPEANQNG